MFQHILQRLVGALRPKNMQLCIRQIRRDKERKALGMVVMQMTEQQQHFTGALGPCQLAPQGNDASSSIEKNCPFSHPDFHRSGIPTKFHCPCPRRGITPAHTPEFDSQFIQHSTPPMYFYVTQSVSKSPFTTSSFRLAQNEVTINLCSYYPHRPKMLKESFRMAEEQYVTRDIASLGAFLART